MNTTCIPKEVLLQD